MPFLDSDTCAEGGAGGYLYLPGFFSLYNAIHGWMDESRDEKSFTKNDHDVLYYMLYVIIDEVGTFSDTNFFL
jgi:hypothetical protein